MKHFFGVVVVTLFGGIALFALLKRPQVEPIKVAALHSITGTMAINEAPLVDAVRLTIEEINDGGGLLGRPVELIVADGKSNDQQFARLARQLIEEDQVSVLFACWTSSCRKAIKPVVEKHNHLLFYPLQYEGLEKSPNIVYTGSALSQQIIPGTSWALDRFGKRVYLLGSDYIFHHTANLIIRDLVNVVEGTVLAEHYEPLGETDFVEVIADIKRLKPGVVLNTINGDSNIFLFDALREAELKSLPVVSFSIAEVGQKAINRHSYHPNHYAVWSYFQSLDNAKNRLFVDAYKSRFGEDRVVSDPVEAAHSSVLLWAAAVRAAGTDNPRQVNRSIVRQSVAAPSGVLAIDTFTRHLWKPLRISHARPDGQFDIIFDSKRPLHPSPFPSYRGLAEWQHLTHKLKTEQEHAL